MKNVMLVLLSLVLAGCVTDLCKLQVVNGSGSGSYQPFSTVPIVANPPAVNTGFQSWEGDISGIGEKTVASTDILMNQMNKTVTAVYTNNVVPPPVPPPVPPVVTNVPGPGAIDNSNLHCTSGNIGDKASQDQWTVWKNSSGQGMSIRLSCNDKAHLPGIPSKDGFYMIAGGNLQNPPTYVQSADGGITATAQDTASKKTGQHYHFCGWLVCYSSAPLQTVYQIHVAKKDCHDTLRPMFVAVE